MGVSEENKTGEDNPGMFAKLGKEKEDLQGSNNITFRRNHSMTVHPPIQSHLSPSSHCCDFNLPSHSFNQTLSWQNLNMAELSNFC